MTFYNVFDRIVQKDLKGVFIMKTMDLGELHNSEFFVKNIICDLQFWHDLSSWCTPDSGRINTAVMMVLSKNVVYKLRNGETVRAYPGDIVLLPKGAVYSCTFHKCEDGIDLKFQGFPRSCLFLGFELFDKDFESITFSGNPRVIIGGDKSSDLLRSFERLCKLYKRQECTPGMLCGETVTFLSQLCAKYNTLKSRDASDEVMESIAAYIFKNAACVTVEDIINMSGMSPSTFRRRFSSKFGSSPVAYINSMKIENAKSCFESGITKIRDVSTLCGIEDEFYFSRLFTKITGVSPTGYLKMIKNLNK